MTRYSYPYGDSYFLRYGILPAQKAEQSVASLPYGFDLSNPGDMLMISHMVREIELATGQFIGGNG
jgi:hypothetical protein